ncbi:LysR family transcriptional regulator [Roseomonas mucosa]|uniref:LysR family transcriptional regulator n=1 Tax=Roseomonas mucosa TaxID=207340 RepID=UPI0022404635|nr:LysR family transcriptional regulator [Roseomonas mucosa]
MELRQLETFCAIIAGGSLTAAARLTGRSQPAISRQLQELEAALGFTLFERNGPRITPTEQGLRFHDEVEPSLAGLRRLEERAAAIARGELASLDIAAIPALAMGLIPRALARLPAEDLPRNLGLGAVPAGEVVRQLLDRRAVLGFASLPVDHQGLDVHWLGESRCVAVLPAAHPLAGETCLPLRALDGERLITVADPHRLRHRIETALARAEARPRGLMAVNASILAASAARAGLGVALIDPVTAQGLPATGLAIRPLDTAIPFFWSVLTPAARPPSLLTRRVIEAAREAAEELPGFRLHPPRSMDLLTARQAASPQDDPRDNEEPAR